MVDEFDDATTHLDTVLSIPSQMTIWKLTLDVWYDPLRSIRGSWHSLLTTID